MLTLCLEVDFAGAPVFCDLVFFLVVAAFSAICVPPIVIYFLTILCALLTSVNEFPDMLVTFQANSIWNKKIMMSPATIV